MNPYLIKLKDGFIKDFETDENSIGGCPTCDYGSEYINHFEITLSGRKIIAETNQMYEYGFSIGEMMKIFLSKATEFASLTEDEFIEWFKSTLSERIGSFPWNYGALEFNVKDI